MTNQFFRDLVIKDVRVIPMVPGKAKVIESLSIYIHKGRIEAFGPFADMLTQARENDPLIIDGTGKTLLPGLIDAHVHVWDEAELAAYLAHGVTGIRNMSGLPFHLKLIDQINQKKILSPDLVSSSPILNSPGPNSQINHHLVETKEQAQKAVRDFHRQGYSLIKIYSNLNRQAYEGILQEAKKLGLSITGHTPEGVRAQGIPHSRDFMIPFRYSLEQDFKTIEHVESVVWHGLRDQLDIDQMNQLASDIVQSGTPVTTTLLAHANLVRVAQSNGEYLKRSGTETLNPLMKIFEADTYQFWSSQKRLARELPRADFYLKATKLLHEADVTLVAGSDAGIFTNIPGTALIEELKLLVQAGLSPYEAIKSATFHAANASGFKNCGQVVAGYHANLILINGNPLEDITS